MRKRSELILLSIVYLVSIAYAQTNFENNLPYIDPAIEQELGKSYRARVFIDLWISESELKHGDFHWNVEKITLTQKEFEFYFTNDDFLPLYKFNMVAAYSGFITRQGLEKLRKNPLVKSITVVGESEKLLNTSAPLIGASKLWDLGYNGSGKVVCVVDTGINYTHSSLGGCTDSQFVAGNCSTVIGGFNFCANEACTTNNTNPMDKDGHGTLISGILISNDSKNRGVAFGAKLVVMKVTNSTGEGPFDLVGSGIDRCILNRTVYNISII